MKAGFWEDINILRVKDVPVPQMGPTDVRIRVAGGRAMRVLIKP